MKKKLSLVVVLIVLFGIVGMSSAASLPFKIGLVTGTVSQGEEEYRAGVEMAERYPGSVIHVTYPDNFMNEQETVIGQIVQFAMDPQVKAIIVVQSVPGTVAAFNTVREFRDDILLIMGSPHEAPDIVAEAADLVLEMDQPQRGVTMAQLAKEMGATKILHYSFPRHMSMELLAERYDSMKAEADKIGIEVIQVTTPDPMGDSGLTGTQQFILEDIPRQVSQHGKDIAFFGTNCGMMEPAISASLDAGIIFVEQCCPSPYHGYPGALGIEVPSDKAGDIDYLIAQISDKISAKGGTGRFATWMAPVNMVYIESAVEMVIRHFDTGFDFGDMKAVEAAIYEFTDVELSLSDSGFGGNFYLVVSPSVIF